MLTLLFYLLTRLLGHGVSQVTPPATELCQSTFVAHSKYKQLSFPGIFFFLYFILVSGFFFFLLHSIKTIAGFLSHSRDLLEIIAISHTY